MIAEIISFIAGAGLASVIIGFCVQEQISHLIFL